MECKGLQLTYPVATASADFPIVLGLKATSAARDVYFCIAQSNQATMGSFT